MNKYEKLASDLEEKIIGNKGTVEITPKDAMEIYLCLRRMERIQRMLETEL